MKQPRLKSRGIPGVAAALALALTMLLFSGSAFASNTTDYRTVDGVAIYYAVVPAEIIRGYSKGSPESAMHGGVPKGKHVHHIIIALFDGRSLERITDAQVTATVGEVGFGRRETVLEPFTVAGALTYGNYFEFSELATYTIDIEILRPGSSKVVRTRFEYRHH